jgi:aspartate/methionine/tyrosine aminotransferase
VREIVMNELAGLDDLCEIPLAKGAFYLLLRLPHAPDAMTLAEQLIREHRVAVVPGNAFGVSGECTLRVSYGALTADTAREGTRRLVDGLRAILTT